MSHVASYNSKTGNITGTDILAGVPAGSNLRSGTSTLVAGTVVVPNTNVTANSMIFLTDQDGGGTEGFLVVSARTPGTSFTILSSSGTHTGKIAWLIVEPSA